MQQLEALSLIVAVCKKLACLGFIFSPQPPAVCQSDETLLTLRSTLLPFTLKQARLTVKREACMPDAYIMPITL